MALCCVALARPRELNIAKNVLSLLLLFFSSIFSNLTCEWKSTGPLVKMFSKYLGFLIYSSDGGNKS